MFTGIIEELGIVSAAGRTGAFEVTADKVCRDVERGDSIAVNGVCLTLTEIKGRRLRFDVMAETRERSNLGMLKAGEKVNLERSLKAGSYISGHFVYGHIDCMRKIVEFGKEPGSAYLDIGAESPDFRYIVEKGSIAVDGISLTVGKILPDRIRLYLIPHTIQNTTLSFRKPGDAVNVEFDMLAKYVTNRAPLETAITSEFLERTGFAQ
ncbi:MAG: riboflavin synthase [Candidatus Omnitrophota bacterium]